MVDQTNLRRSARGARGFRAERSLKKATPQTTKMSLQPASAAGRYSGSHPALFQMIYLEITYAQKDEAKPFGVRWDPKEKLWYFPGDVLPQELERFRPTNTPKGPVDKIILDIPFSYRDVAFKAGARWDSEIKA
jgi:Domain of unknown function (DUF5710)